jgi:hypothetical protein
VVLLRRTTRELTASLAPDQPFPAPLRHRILSSPRRACGGNRLTDTVKARHRVEIRSRIFINSVVHCLPQEAATV